jgi:PAS domain S-box-containing protein
MMQSTPYTGALLLAALVSLVVAAAAWQRRGARGWRAMVAILLGAAQWALASALQLASASQQAQYFWYQARFIGTEVVALAFLAFALRYLGRPWPSRRTIVLLLVVPVASLILLYTNHWHWQFFTAISRVDLGSFSVLEAERGPLFWLHTIYAYGLMMAGLLLFGHAFIQSPRLYRAQIVAILVAALAPLAANAITLSGYSPFPYLDLTPFGFTITGLALAAGFVGFGMLDIVPAARDAVIQHMSDAVFVLDHRQRVIDLNPAAERVCGRPASEVVGRPAAMVLEGWQGLPDAGEISRLRETVISLPAPGGQTARDFEVHVSPITDGAGQVTGHVLMLRDFTEQRQAEASLRHSQARFDDVIENIADSYYEADLNGVLTFVNQQFARAVGAEREAIIGQHFRRFTDRDSARTVFGAFHQVYQTGKPISLVDYRAVLNDGSMLHAELSVSLRRETNGQPVGFRGIIRDMSDRWRAEEELKKAKEAAEAANQAKSTFLTTVSHELRTPLTSVLGFAKLIKKRLNDIILPAISTDDQRVLRAGEQVSANIDIITAEGERLTALINNVLDLAKIEAGRVDWNLQPTSLSAIIERAASATQSLAEQKQLALITDIAPNLPQIIGDQDRLIQVVINLISNAIKFTQQGTVACRARREGSNVVVSVTDTGMGIGPGDLARVFEEFVQVGNTLTDKPTGTGLGLPICRQIVEHHGGRIWVESELGRGSTFSFRLPIGGPSAAGPADDAPLPGSVEIEALIRQLKEELDTAQPNGNGTRKSILIVDDDDNIRELLRQELESDGYQVHEAADGRAALWQVREAHPDLIIMDVMMPELSGLDVAAVLRSDPATRRIPIIIASIIPDEEHGYRVGIDRYFTKPLDLDLLLNEVSVLLRRGKSAKRVLVIEEDAAVVQALTQVLEAQGYSVAAAANGQAGLQQALAAPPDILIVNSLQPGQRQLVQTLRFEKGLENVALMLFH